MRQPKPRVTVFNTTQPAPWMKIAFFIQAGLFIIAALFFWDQWETAQNELARQSLILKSKTEANEALRRERENSREFLEKYSNDEEFRMRIAKQRLNYTEPGEVVFRLDPPPKPVKAPEEQPRK